MEFVDKWHVQASRKTLLLVIQPLTFIFRAEMEVLCCWFCCLLQVSVIIPGLEEGQQISVLYV